MDPSEIRLYNKPLFSLQLLGGVSVSCSHICTDYNSGLLMPHLMFPDCAVRSSVKLAKLFLLVCLTFLILCHSPFFSSLCSQNSHNISLCGAHFGLTSEKTPHDPSFFSSFFKTYLPRVHSIKSLEKDRVINVISIPWKGVFF